MPASQEKDFSVVAAERPHGTASTERSLFTRPPQIVIPLLGAGRRGLVCRLGVPTPAQFDGEFRKGLQDMARVHRRALSWEDNEPAA